MRRNRSWMYLAMLILSGSCITPFDPDIKTVDENRYVVQGELLAGEDICRVNISRTSPLQQPAYLPVSGCAIAVSDSTGQTLILSETTAGQYEQHLDPDWISPGMAYHIIVSTPDGTEIRSDPDILTTGPPVDQVYYERQEILSGTSNKVIPGIQFYVDLHAAASNSHFYRWEAIETWEYHTEYPLEWYYDGSIHHVVPPDYSLNVCWRTLRVPSIYNLSTSNLTVNEFMHFPLHFVNNMTSRLAYGYSLEVKQHSLSAAAYTYYDQLRVNNEQVGGLYEKQPLAVRGNMHDLHTPDHVVLGFFSASTVTSRRIFVEPLPDLDLNYPTFCDPYRLVGPLSRINPSLYPIYILGNQFGPTGTLLDGECVDCRLLGGVTTKPAFWPH